MKFMELESAQKLRGGYYTPESLAAWLCRWAIRKSSDTILEPSSGDGAFLAAAGRRLTELGTNPKDAFQNIRGIELLASEAKAARARMRQLLGTHPNGQIVCADFFEWSQRDRQHFDCVVGNPPFIRYQNFPEPSRSHAIRMMTKAGFKPNKLTNIWVPFVVGAAIHLREGGRMALVLPAELLQVSYAAQLRMFLAEHFSHLHLYACNHLFFSGAEQEVVLLLADSFSSRARKDTACLIHLVEAGSIQGVTSSRPNDREATTASLDHSTEKWLKYFLKTKEIDFMRSLKSHEGIASVRAHAQIDIGIVTGRNEFFVVGKRVIDEYDLAQYTIPLVGRSSQLKGARIDPGEWKEFSDQGLDVNLLLIDGQIPLHEKAKRYIQLGERLGYHQGFKCSIRKPWYHVPSVWVPACFFFRQIYDFPRIVVNECGATSTDTIHRMRCLNDPSSISINLYTHLSAASAEIEGRSYGGGVLELEPTEAEKMLMPRTLQQGLPLTEIDRLVRAGKLSDVLAENDRLVLGALGFSKSDRKMLKDIWTRMRTRRSSRKRGQHP